MKLEVRIEEQQKGFLHASLERLLEIAARYENLDHALDVLRINLNPRAWLIGRGGHHVWVSARRYQGPVRVAMIAEVQS